MQLTEEQISSIYASIIRDQKDFEAGKPVLANIVKVGDLCGRYDVEISLMVRNLPKAIPIGRPRLNLVPDPSQSLEIGPGIGGECNPPGD